MKQRLPVLLFLVALALGQEAQPTIRVEVKSSGAPVPDAAVVAGGQSAEQGRMASLFR